MQVSRTFHRIRYDFHAWMRNLQSELNLYFDKMHIIYVGPERAYIYIYI